MEQRLGQPVATTIVEAGRFYRDKWRCGQASAGHSIGRAVAEALEPVR